MKGYPGDKTVGEVASKLLHMDVSAQVPFFVQSRLFPMADELKNKSLDDLLSDEILLKMDGSVEKLSRLFVVEIKEYLHSEQGTVWLESIILQLLEGKKMLGFLAGMLFDGKQIQQKLIAYLDQLLDQPDSFQIFTVFLKKEWHQWKEKQIGEWIEPFEPYLKEQVLDWTHHGVKKIEEVPVKQLLQRFHEDELFRTLYDQAFEFVQERLEQWFSYLSIAKVVKEQVNQFSLRKLENMIVEVSGKELKMITYFGGILGGVIGLVQGLIFYFY
ncbi:DUF445 family protein [Tepidibacillus marianensis]|uniref:DUF445 family protein n=1 Tax=Tepidibacillus marianensis TaxID=3131995 RepID=UPI0030CE57ED